MTETIEVYAYCCKGISGAPPDKMGMYITADKADQPRALDTWAAQSYWAVATDAQNNYPPVLMHIHFEGELPNEATRDVINRQVQQLTGKLLFNQD